MNVKTMAKQFRISIDSAARVSQLIHDDIYLDDLSDKERDLICRYGGWDFLRNYEIMILLDHYLEGYGVEAIRSNGEIFASYVNTGDTYNLTIVTDGSNFIVTTLGDFTLCDLVDYNDL